MATCVTEGQQSTSHEDPADKVAYDADAETSPNDALTADFRAQLGLLLDEEEGLTEVFKARIGLLGDEPLSELTEVELAVIEEREQTLSRFKYRQFAKNHFQQQSSSSFSAQPLEEPLLKKGHRVDRLASLAVWMGILRYMGDIPTPKESSNKVDKVPVMTKLYTTLDKHVRHKDRKGSTSNGESEKKDIVSFKLTKRQSWKKFFGHRASSVKKTEVSRRNSMNHQEFEYSAEPEAILDILPVAQLDLVHFIVGHGILRREMRDEIYCQLCKQLTDNPSSESATKGWILMAFCTGCFKPSEEFRKHLKSFLNDAPDEFKDRASYAHRMLRRSFANGTRFHPPNWLECQAVQAKQFVVLPVSFANDQVESIEVDAATTSTEMCAKLANKIGLKDLFGFSIFVSIFHKVSSLGSGVDHIMDAISECEQVSRTKGKREEDATWRLYFRKELFAPWNDPTFDEVAANLIYEQICKGIRSLEYSMPSEEALVKYAARRYFVEHGAPLQTATLQSKLERYLPKTALSGARSRDGWLQAISASYADEHLADGTVSATSIKEKMVSSAPHRWPVHFSALFVAFKLAGPRLPKNEVVIAVGGEGFFVLDRPFHVILALHYYEIVEVFSSRTGKMHGQSFNMVTVKGDEFTFASPNAEIITQLIMFFLNGLRHRSVYAVGLDNFAAEGATDTNPFRFHQGDLITLIERPEMTLKDDWGYGKCERTDTQGKFPMDLIYVLPTTSKPPEEFLNCFRTMTTKSTETLPRKRGTVFISKGTIGRHAVYGKDSAA